MTCALSKTGIYTLSHLHQSICKSYASIFKESNNTLYGIFLGVKAGGSRCVPVCRFLASKNVCSVGKHQVCVGGQSVLFYVSQCPQLFTNFV